MIQLSNMLAAQAEAIKTNLALADTAEKAAAETRIDAGHALIHCKKNCHHGEWSAFLSRAGLHERQARRLMQLARSGLKPDMMSDLGGFAATLEYIAKRDQFQTLLPNQTEMLAVYKPGSTVEKEPIAFVWEASKYPGSYHVVIMLLAIDGFVETTKRPILGKPPSSEGAGTYPVWVHLEGTLGVKLSEYEFRAQPMDVEFIESVCASAPAR